MRGTSGRDTIAQAGALANCTWIVKLHVYVYPLARDIVIV